MIDTKTETYIICVLTYTHQLIHTFIHPHAHTHSYTVVGVIDMSVDLEAP